MFFNNDTVQLNQRMADELVADILMRLDDKRKDRKDLLYSLKLVLRTEAIKNPSFVQLVLQGLKGHITNDEYKSIIE